jgi:hypothetical protein
MAGDSTGALINKMSYTHDAMVDLILQNPMISQGDIARTFGYTESWVSQIVRSDSFRESLAARKGELIDPILKASLEDRINALAHRSIDILLEQLDMKGNPEIALKALDLTTRAKNYGAGVHLTQNFVVAMPQKSESGESWIADHQPPRPMRSMITVDTVLETPPA